MEEYDVSIIGCGPAGLSAAIFCGRANLKTIVLGITENSQAYLANQIENYFGFPEGIDGNILLSKGILQAQKFGVKFIQDEAVTAAVVEHGNRFFVVKTGKGNDIKSRAMIIATGTPIRLSGIKNEEKLIGKGIHYCVSCDGAMYKDKKVFIIGNGDHAAEDALEALSYTKDITIVSNAQKFEFSEKFDKELTKWQIKTIIGKVREIRGEKWFESIMLEDGTELKPNGIFMACGIAGALDFAANLGLEIKDNLIVIDDKNMTNLEGVFAAGNCAGRCRQIAKNIGDGCNASVNVIKYLRSRELYFDYAHGHESSKDAKVREKEMPAAKKENKDKAPDSSGTKKLRVGWFSFSCCEDSTILFTELLNDYYDKLNDVIEFAYVRVLRKNNDMTNLDIAFVEGAISNDKAAEELRKIRENSKKLIAIGACAVTGMPSGQRNMFDEGRKREIEPIIRAFDYSKDVKPLHEIVTVDDSVPGCPMNESVFINVLNKQLKEFGIDAQL